MRPLLTYYGGKQKLAKHILPLIPKHDLYCEPFFGGGAVYFAKPPSEIEVINDTNGDLVNFYKVAKNSPKRLEQEIKATLYSRESHQSARVILGFPKLFNRIQRAWAIWVLANESHASRLDSSWGYDRKRNTSAKRLYYKREEFTKNYSKRLEMTEFENTDALKVIETRDGKRSFFYCDPPYFNAVRGHFEKYTDRDFESLLKVLITLQGKFILSSYPSELLNKYVKANNWHYKEIKMLLDISVKDQPGKNKTEVLVANYPIA